MKLLTTAITLFFVLDPFGNLPFALSLLSRIEEKRRWKVMLRESVIALVTLLLFFAAGPMFIKFLGVGPSDLSICGGVVLGIIALRMVFPDDRQGTPKENEPEPFIVPLAIPLIAGPSALATVMLVSAQPGVSPLDGLATIMIAWVATAVTLVLGVKLGAAIPPRLLNAFERLAGLLLAVIAVHMIMSGIQTYLVVPKSGL